MPGPDKVHWKARPIDGSFQFNEADLTVTYLVCLEKPDRFRDRIVQVVFTHEIALNTFGIEAIGAIKEFGNLLPEEMGDTPNNPG